MERHTRLSRAAVVLVTIALIAAIAAAVWFASPQSPYVPSEDSGAALGTAAPAEDGTVAEGYQPSSTGTGISSMDPTRSDTDGDFYLTQDIEITSLHSDDWGQAFSGTLDGAGHTITINAETKNTGCSDAGGLFIGVNAGATIKNMTIVVNSFHYGTSAKGTANGGIIGGYASGDKITVDNVKVILNQDSNTMYHGTSTYNGVDTYMYSTTGDHNSIAFNFGGLFGKVEGGTTTIKNTTVYNSAGGKYGFSAWTWVSTPLIGNGESWINIGGFVGSVQANKEGTDGTLTLQNVKYDADDDAKISALAESGTDRNNYARLSPFLGVLNAGKFKVDNLIFNAGGTFTSMFYRDDTTKNEHNEGMYNGRGILVGYDVNKYLQNEGINYRTDVYFRNAITGDSGTGLGNGDEHTSLLAGNNSWLDGFMSYPSEIEDASFTDDGKIAFALPNRSGDIAKAVRQINQNGNVTTVSDAQIAEQVTEGGGLTWIEAPVVAHGDDTSVSASLNKVSTGAYSVQNYDAVSSAGDSAYRGSKVYDGTPVATPTLNVGGTTVNAWTADSTTEDVGTKTFSYNADALSGYAAAAYNGGTYLVKDGTIYSPGTITVNGAAQPFDLDKDFVYEITPAPVEVVVANIPGTFYEGDPMPELNVQSVTPNVPGKIEWNDSSLVYGQNEYGWTWTPESNNYQPDTGTVMLEVLQATINEIVVSGDFETRYTAYDAFDPDGMVVTAYYVSDSEHERGVVLESSDYTVSVANGDINRLLVANTFVTVTYNADNRLTDTAAITVSELVVDVPTAVADLVYNGEQQTGVEEGGHYTLSGNTGTNAAAYTATATLTDKANTRWDTDTEDDTADKSIAWSIAKENVAITVMHTSKTYDGQEVVPTTLFNAQGVNNDALALTVTVDGGKTILGAGTYSVTASLAESETNYTAVPVTITFTIETIKVSGSVAFTTSAIYDGTEKVAEFTLTSPDVLIGDDQVTITYSVEDRTNVTGQAITATAVLPSGDNYAWADDTAPSATFTISPKAVEIESIQELTKTYDGQEVDPSSLFPAPNGVDGQPIELTITVDGGKTILGAGTYTVSAKPTSANYAGACEVEYIIQKASPSVTVKVDTDTTYYSSQSLYDIVIEAEEPSVAGNIAWEDGQVLSAATTEYSWVFTPDDVDNYEIVTGKVTLKVENVTLNRIEVTKNPDKMSYVAYSDFDATGMIVTAYFDGAEDRVLGIEELTLSGNTNLQYGDGEATITITFQEKTATVTVNVTKMLIPVPQAQTGIVFDGELHTGIVEDEQWSQYYQVDTESGEQRYAGTYTAVVNLNDVNNTAWEGTGDSEPKEIPWTIEHVAIEVTVNAESKTVEYGTAYSWDPYNFFAVEVTNSDLFEVKLGVFNDGSITDISTANVGEYREGIFASVTRKDGGALGEQDLASFEFSQDITQLAMKVIVTAKTVEVALDENVVFAAYDGEKLSEEELFGMFKTEMNIEDLAFEVDGVPYDAAEIVNAGEYTVKVVSDNGNYDLTGTTEGVYKIAKATLTVTASVESEGLDTSDDLYAVPLIVEGVGVNGEKVSGTGVWASGQSLSPGTNIYKFVFTPDQEFAVNYEVYEGECEIANVSQATLTGVSVEVVATTEYVAFDAFDRSSIAVEALYGEDRKPVTDYTLTFSIGAEGRLFAGTGITVTVTYTDGEVTQSTEFTIDVAKRAVAKPVVDTTVFDATGETITLPIAESEYYTVYGNTAIEPGRYVATVELNDPANTMWEDGSTDVVSIAWTISEPVTSDEVIASILAMEKVTWQNAEEFLDLEARYGALDESEQTAEATAKLATLKAQYDALRNAAFDDIEAAHEVTAKSLGKALAAAAAGLSAAAIALAIAKRRSI